MNYQLEQFLDSLEQKKAVDDIPASEIEEGCRLGVCLAEGNFGLIEDFRS